MYTSGKKTWAKLSLIYLGLTIFTALFGAVYEIFSHEVYSYYMIYAFAVPLVLGVLPNLICLVRNVRNIHPLSVWFWNAGVITLTVGALFHGALEIFGTINKLAIVYQIASSFFFLVSIILKFLSGKGKNLQETEEE